MDAITIVLFVAGLALAIGGAEALVRGASRLAAALGVSPLVIGLTVVAFGTSSPELAVSVQSSLLGLSGVSLGNVVGSNIFNVLLILGLSALVAPLTVAQQLIRLDVPLMIGVSLVAYLFALDGNVGRFEGVMLFAGIVAYTVFLILESRRESRDIEKEYAQEFGERPRGALQILINLLLVGAGLGMLVIGSRWLIDGAVAIARMLGVSEVVIALTLIAGGTSLPEVATSVVASIRGERDIAVGNIVGSNIFNLLSVLGVSAAVSPHGIAATPQLLSFDFPIMLAVAFACLPIFLSGTIARWEGALFLAYYVAYTLYLVFSATQNPLLPSYNTFMLSVALPLTVITLVLIAVRTLRQQRQQAAS
ncbi:MAG: calcium/sodium antiporter [Thermoflexales bacterium]|nr:calcium/sodium antiporter [Thermoflexales bacterium]MCS7324672.1 calcium/sodium antiporter [Thermoflexales bacterium]MDW8053183.1 calcium/sodium antiporter [Anaerolineae bacterium]MDW8291834.1 calcium/sodium antiporter [Anaerolineae bacterium]